MKKILFLAAMLLGVVSCQRDQEGFDVAVGGEQETVITLSLPEVTRSMSNTGFDFEDFANNTDYDLRFILEIHHGDKVVRDVQTSKNGTSATFSVRLVAGREYTFAAWADLVDEDTNTDLYYNTANGLANITLKEWTPMTEARDAYTCTVTEEFNPQTGVTMELKRPFAKVRVVSTDIQKVIDLGIEPTKAVVDYTSDLYTKYDAVLGAVAGTAAPKNHTFNYADVDSYTDNAGEKTMFTDYILVPKGEGETVIFSIDIQDATGTIKKTEFNSAIPVEVNKLTTLRGAVLTEGGKVSITVDGELGEKETINVVGTASDLQQAINAIEVGEEGNIQLGGDIDLNNLLSAGILSTRASANAGLVIPEGKSVVLDLNGFTISQSKACDASYSMIANNGNLTITGEGTIEFTNTAEGGSSVWGTYTIENRGEGVLTIDNATIRHNGSVNGDVNRDTNIAIQNYEGKVVVNNGTIASTQFRSLRDFTAGGEIIINGGTFLGQVWMQGLGSGSSSLTINGGNFTPVVGYDGSSVYITNSSNIVNVAVNGGVFNTKIGCYDATKEGAKGCITGGTFTTEAKEGTNAALINDDYAWVEAEGLWTIERKADVAKIGEVGYTSLAKAVAEVKDGETITLVADEVFTENNYYDNGGWKDGLGYSGDKSFTIDLNSKTIRQNGALNDYLIWIKNDGSKANTITLKNGTLDAGTTAYCAFATASSNKQKMTINLEDINLVGNNSNGAVAKIRGGAELNVKSGTVITGKNNYVGIEAVGNNTVVNIYDNTKIYQNGTGSYVGAIVGASYNATMNIYGGYGKSAKCGIIVMSTGATINVFGGEWIANNDGTVANDNNAVLVSQNNRYETGWACKSILNVTGGTFKGGYNCYGMGPGVEPDDAQINIKGGNFNANPANYVAEGFGATEDNGLWTVAKSYDITEEGYTILTAPGMFWFANEVNSGANYFEGKTIKLGADIDLNNAEWTPIGSAYKDHGFMGNFDGNGYSIKNLKMTKIAADSDGYVYAGLFGVTEGVDKDNQNYIKNLTIENVTIDLNGHIVAAAIAYPYYTALENITVKGNVSIKGGDYTSGVLAYTRRCVDANNISIEANAGSVIEGNITVGGVISDIQMNGGLTANYSNFKAENLTIKGTQCVGGISGIIGAQNLDGAIVKNVTIVSDDIRTGMISGSFDGHSVITNAVVENVTGADYYIGYLYKSTEGDRSSVTINGDVYTYNNGWLVNGCQIVADGLLKDGNTYIVKSANGLVALSGMTIKGGEIVTLGADINLEGVEFNGLNAFNPENNNTFDGQNYTVSNWTYEGGAGDMGFIRNWVGPVKDVKFENCHLKTAGRSAVVAAKIYGNMENVLVNNCSIVDSYWACGLVAGLYNSGSVSNVTVTNSSVKSNGGTAAIVGVFNESEGERGLKNCSVSNTTINNTGVYGEVYSGGALVGMFNSNATFIIEGCTVSNNTLEGGYVYEKYPANESVIEK